MNASAIESAPARSHHRAYRIALFALIFLALAKAVTFLGAGQPFPESDGVNYWKMGNEFAQGDWLLRQRAWAFRPPGYPLYLAAMHTAFGTYGIAAASIFQMLADFALALVTAWSCAKVAGNRAGALVGLALSFCCISRSCFMVHLLADTPAILALYHRFAARLFRKTVTS